MGDGADLIRELVALRERRETGVLEVAHGGIRAFLYIDRGEPVFAEHGTLGDSLGRVLLRLGAITLEQYAAIIRVMTSQLVDNEQLRFGEVAVELGFLSHEQMRDALAAQVRQKILTTLEWDGPEHLFVPGPEALEGIVRFPCSVDRLVLEAVRAFDDEGRVHAILEPHLERRVVLAWPLAELERRIPLSGHERRFLQLVGGRTRLRALLAGEEATDATARLAAALILLEAFALGDAAPTRPPERPVRIAHASPVRTPGGPAEGLRRPLARHPRPEPTERDRRLAAELALRAGRAHMAAAAWREALEELRRARELDPEASEYGLYVAWAELQASPDAARDEARRAELVREATAARKRDPHFGFAYYVIGAVRMEEGDTVKAAAALRKAIELDPQIRDAERRLRLLHMRTRKKR